MTRERWLSLADFEAAAARRLPKGIHGFIAGAAEDGASAAANRRAFDDWSLVPRVLADTSTRTLATTLLGHEWSAPFGIAPMGVAGIAAFRADLVFAAAAARAGIPFVLSNSSLVTMERVLAANGDSWFQLYPTTAAAADDALVARVRDAGFVTLVVTVDVPVAGNREADRRNGYTSPLWPTPRLVLDAARHPRWLAGCLARTWIADGRPHFENLASERVPMIARRPARSHRRDSLSWNDLARLRERWPHRLVIKGVLASDDVARAVGVGVDAAIVSNHGGRQLDGAVAPLRALTLVRAASDSLPLIVDGGIRRGTHLLKALALGASFGLIGRPFLFAAAAAGAAGVDRAIALMKEELARDLALMGARAPSDVRDRVVPSDPRADGLSRP